MRTRQPVSRVLYPGVLLFAAFTAGAQDAGQDERVEGTRPEAWAMNYFTATTYMTAFGATPDLAPLEWTAAVELGEVPHLDASQREVGFNGSKHEDLNKVPLFGRLRVQMGLPAGWVAELGYTPAVEVNGLKARGLVAAALGRRFVQRERFVLSARLMGQHGSAAGDITCPEELAGSEDPAANPYGCEAASRDRAHLDYYGIDATSSWIRAAWEVHATLGIVRTEPQVQVDALTFGVRDRSRITTKDVLPYLAIGASRRLQGPWRAGAELLYVPLRVRRPDDDHVEDDPLLSLQIRLSYTYARD